MRAVAFNGRDFAFSRQEKRSSVSCFDFVPIQTWTFDLMLAATVRGAVWKQLIGSRFSAPEQSATLPEAVK